MVLKHWKLIEPPFRERVDARRFFTSATHQAALFKLRTAIAERAGLVVVAGPPGVGKSMLGAVLAESLSSEEVTFARLDLALDEPHPLLEPLLQRDPGTARYVMRGRDADDFDSGLMGRLRPFFGGVRQHLEHPIVLLDGAQHLAEADFRKLVLALTRQEAKQHSVLTGVMIGPTELLVRAARLASPGNACFRRCLVGALTKLETASYVSQAVRRAGGPPAIFSDHALEAIFDLSGGVPRRINRLGDLSLLIGYSEGRSMIDASEVWMAQSEVGSLGATRTATCRTTRRWKPLVHR